MALALTNPASQTVVPGANVIFNTLADQSCCNACNKCNGVCWRKATGSIKLCSRFTTYEVTFQANIGGAADVQKELAIAIGGEVIPYTKMVFTPTGTEFGHVSVSIPIYNCCCDFDRITVKNIGTGDVVIGTYPSIVVKRLSKEA